jgi:hypothetical protein
LVSGVVQHQSNGAAGVRIGICDFVEELAEHPLVDVPSHSKENKDYVEFFHNEGKALDINAFEPSQPKPKRIKDVAVDYDKERLLDSLEKIGVLDYDEWFAVCCALKDNGFEYSDFERVSEYLRQGKANDSQGNWDRANINAECTYDMGWVQRLINSRLSPTDIKLHVKDITVLKPLHGSIIPELKQAYDSIDKFGVIQAQPGAGKTTMITAEVIIEVMAKNKVFVVVQSKDQMAQLAAALKIRLDTGDFKQFGIVFLEATESMPVGDDTSAASIPDGALAVITHFTYAGRWGESPYLYSALKFVDENTLVLIDEVDAYVDSLVIAHDFGGRAKRQVVGGQTQDKRIASCLVRSGSGNCSQCFAKHDNAAEYIIGDYHVPEFSQHMKFSDNTIHKFTPKYDYKRHNAVVEIFNTGTNEITILSQTPEEEVNVDLFHVRGGDNNINRNTTLEDMFKSVYCPTIHRPFIQGNNVEVYVPTIRKLMSQPDGKFSVANLDRTDYKFPVRPCNVLTFVGFNRKPFFLYRRAKKVIGFSATLASIHKSYLTEMLPDSKFIKVPVHKQRKLKKLILVGLDNKVSMTSIINGELKSGSNTILKFCPKKNTAQLERTLLVENGIDAALFTNKLSKTDIADASRITNTDIKYVISHALGSLGRGLNLPEFKIVSVDLGAHKPTCAYSTSDKRALLVAMLDQQLATVVQNAGRIFRWEIPVEQDSGIRVVFVENLRSISDDLRTEFKVNSTDVYNYLKEAFAESFEDFEEWLIPVFQSKDATLKDLSHVFTHLNLPVDRLVTWDDCIDEIKKTGTGNGSRIRDDVLDVCSVNMSETIKSAKAEYNSGIRSKAAGKSTEKTITDKKMRIDQLITEGKTPGVIKSALTHI